MKIRSLRHAFVIAGFAALLLLFASPAHACGASLSISAPDSTWRIHITATITKDADGDCLGATFTLNGQPTVTSGSLNITNSGQGVTFAGVASSVTGTATAVSLNAAGGQIFQADNTVSATQLGAVVYYNGSFLRVQVEGAGSCGGTHRCLSINAP